MNSSAIPLDHIGGLSHLVEAASALSKLSDVNMEEKSTALSSHTTTTTTEVSCETKPATTKLIVSDDEGDSKSSQRQMSPPMKDTFPQRLMELLEGPYADVISWLPHGRAFVVLRPDVFSETILPRYFQCADIRASTKYPSFTRKLNRWGFRQATRGSDTGAFFHPLFRKDKPELCLEMVCQKSRKTANTSGKCNSKNKKKKTSLPSLVHALFSEKGLQLLPTSQSCNEVRATTSLNSDVNSVTPQCPSSPVSPSSMYTMHLPILPLSHLVPNDPQLVAKALRERDEAEKLKIAKTMLFQAYLNALKG